MRGDGHVASTGSLGRQVDGEGAAARGAVHVDAAAHQIHVALDDGQPQAGVGRIGVARGSARKSARRSAGAAPARCRCRCRSPSSWTWPLTRPTLRSMAPCGRLYSTALCSRLLSTSRSLSGSTCSGTGSGACERRAPGRALGERANQVGALAGDLAGIDLLRRRRSAPASSRARAKRRSTRWVICCAARNGCPRASRGIPPPCALSAATSRAWSSWPPGACAVRARCRRRLAFSRAKARLSCQACQSSGLAIGCSSAGKVARVDLEAEVLLGHLADGVGQARQRRQANPHQHQAAHHDAGEGRQAKSTKCASARRPRAPWVSFSSSANLSSRDFRKIGQFLFHGRRFAGVLHDDDGALKTAGPRAGGGPGGAVRWCSPASLWWKFSFTLVLRPKGGSGKATCEGS